MPISPYPRRGQRLAPVGLSDLLDVPVPRRLIAGAEEKRICFTDLDESAWTRFGPSCLMLAEALVQQVRHDIQALPAAVRKRVLPPLPNEIRIEDLELEQRTYNCLWTMQNLVLAQDVHNLGSMTIGQLLALHGFGAKCLVDLLTSVETVLRTRRRPPRLGVPRSREAAAGSRGVTDEGVKCSLFIPSSRHRDLRLPLLPDDVKVSGLRLSNRTYNCLERHGLHERLRDLEDYTVGELLKLPGFWKEALMDLLGALDAHFPGIALRPAVPPERLAVPEIPLEESHTLEEELCRLAARSCNDRKFSQWDRNRAIMVRHLGLDGSCGATFAELARAYSLTRERVRQLCDKVEQGMKCKAGAMPFLDRALTTVKELLPSPADAVEAKLQAAGVTQSRFSLEALATAAHLLGREAPFALVMIGGRRMAVPPGREGLVRRTIRLAREAAAHHGVATTSEVAAWIQERTSQPTTANFVAGIMESQSGFEWLEKESGWFWIQSKRHNRILSRIRYILAVADKIQVSELRGGIVRYYSMIGLALPCHVLLELCRRLPFCVVEGEYVRAEPKLDWRQVLNGVQKTMVQVLMEHGPVMQRAKLAELCLEQGVNRNSFYSYLEYSPVIEQFAGAVYGLRGAKVDPGIVQSLVPLYRPRMSVRLAHGWTTDQNIWIGYRLSESMLIDGIFSIPAELKSFVQGSFPLKDAEGKSVGTAVVEGRYGRGLRPFFRRDGGESGDIVVIVFDLKAKEARLSIDDGDLIEEQQQPDGISEQI